MDFATHSEFDLCASKGRTPHTGSEGRAVRMLAAARSMSAFALRRARFPTHVTRYAPGSLAPLAPLRSALDPPIVFGFPSFASSPISAVRFADHIARIVSPSFSRDARARARRERVSTARSPKNPRLRFRVSSLRARRSTPRARFAPCKSVTDELLFAVRRIASARAVVCGARRDDESPVRFCCTASRRRERARRDERARRVRFEERQGSGRVFELAEDEDVASRESENASALVSL